MPPLSNPEQSSTGNQVESFPQLESPEQMAGHPFTIDTSYTIEPCRQSERPAIPPSILQRRRSSSQSSISNRPPTPTNKLAETAVGVREVSKHIARARVHLDQPKTVMIVNKLQDVDLILLTRNMTLWLIDDVRAADGSDISVYLDWQINDHPVLNYPELCTRSTRYASQIKFWTPALCASSPELIDFIITLGGDGTVLYTSWLFQNLVPPIIPFHLGSLGFLTVFDFSRYQQLLRQVFQDGARVNLRMRFTCTVFKARNVQGQAITTNHLNRRRCDSIHNLLNSPPTISPLTNPESMPIIQSNQLPPLLTPISAAFASISLDPQSDYSIPGTDRPAPSPPLRTHGEAATFEYNGMFITTEEFQVLNELVVDRGPSAYMSQLELFGDEKHLTTVQADGLVVSTPTGSTAYSLSAGGSIVHPEVQAVLVTPICPHTLSFRPMLLPDSMELKVCVPPTSRNSAWASFDGRNRIELKEGDFVSITASKFPFPTICHHDQSSDWFHSLGRCLHWNERATQKAFSGANAGTGATNKNDELVSPSSAKSVNNPGPKLS